MRAWRCEGFEQMSELRDLIEKDRSGTITDAEKLRLKELLLQWATDHFMACPVCGGGISEAIMLNPPSICPLCGIELKRSCFDPRGHSMHDIDASIPAIDCLASFSEFLYPRGTQVCFGCGEVFPERYGCCPSLLAFALSQYDVPGSQVAVVRFLKTHADVLLNCLQGSKYASILDPRYRDLIVKLSSELDCAEELRKCLGLNQD